MTTSDLGGLRERKKTRTREAIQQQALRLFGEQGFAATTMEQIAAAADVSPSTVFRYFASKEELVRFNAHNLPFARAFAAQPADRAPVEAFRGALRELVDELDQEDVALNRQRQQLLLAVPGLLGSSLGDVTGSVEFLAELVAERTGREAADPYVRTLVAAVFGVILVVWLDWADHPEWDIGAVLDESLSPLARGFDPSVGSGR